MPEVADRSIADRSLAGRDSVQVRLNGDIILQPWCAVEGAGDLIELAADGNLEFCKVGQPPVADGRIAAVGQTRDSVTIQNSHPLPVTRTSYTVGGPLIQGGALPDASTPGLARIPKPTSPTVKKLAATVSGYAAYTALSPGFFYWTLVDLKTHAETLPSPPSEPFFGGTGQSYRVPLPATSEVPPGFGIGLYIPEPGTSRPSGVSSANMWRQRVIDPTKYFLPYYDLTGPIRHERRAPTKNETAYGGLGVPKVKTVGGMELVDHHYRFGVTEVDEANNEGILGALTNTITIPSYENGKHFEVHRPALSPGAKGWYLYCLIWSDPHPGDSEGQVDTLPSHYYRAYFRESREGVDFPISAKKTFMFVVGHTTEGYSRYSYDLAQAAPPREDKTGTDAPTSAPDVPTPIGASRPPPGRYYAAQIDADGDALSLPSDLVSYDLAEDQIAQIVFSNPTNTIPNGTYLEVGSNNLPLNHTVDQTNAVARMEDGDLVFETASAQTGATGSVATDPFTVDPTREGSVSALFSVENPPTGAFAGSVQLVLRELTAAGVANDRTLQTATAVGEYDYYQGIDPAGTVGSPFAYRSDTAQAQLILNLAGSTKNARVRSKRKRHKNHKHRNRHAPKHHGPGGGAGPPHPGPPGPPEPPEPGSGTSVSPPPEPPASPETYPVPASDRPLSSGTVLEHATFEAGLPSGWTQNASGGGAISTAGAAALTGSSGLRLLKSAGGSLASAYLSKTFAADYPFILGGRHDTGFYSRLRIASFVGVGSLRIRELARPSDGQPFAWLEVSQQAEVSELTVTDQPLSAGNVRVTVGGVSTLVAVNAVQEVSTLTVNSNPTAAGTVRINLDDGTGVLKPYDVPIGGVQEVQTLAVSGSPTASGRVSVNLAGTTFFVPVQAVGGRRVGRRIIRIGRADTPEQVAQKVAATPFPGWIVSASGRTVTFTSQLPGPRAASSFSANGTGVTAAMTQTVAGAGDTAFQLADRVALGTYLGWTATRGSGTSVVFTAVQGGPRVDATYDPRATGAAGTMAATTQGTIDSPSDLAARIRGTTFSGWTLSGSGAVARFTSNSAGIRQNSSYDPLATGARGQMLTLVQGTNVDLTAFVKDDFGVVRWKKLVAGLLNTTIANVDLAVSGAGTANAIVSAWGSVGTDPLQRLAEFENVSLLNYPSGLTKLGVTLESSASLTWDVHVDELNVTDRGLSWYRHHNARGELLPSLFYYGVPGQPSLQKVPVDGARIPVLPGTSYDLAAFVRYEGIPASQPARPLYVTAHFADGSVQSLGDVTGPDGISGSAGWQEYAFTIVAGENCFELGIDSRDVSVGTIAIQEVTPAFTGIPRRTYAYAAAGSYTATLFVGTPKQLPGLIGRRMRLSLDAVVDADVAGGAASGFGASVQFRGGDPLPGPQPESGPNPASWTPYESDPAAVPQKDYAQARVVLAGNGTDTPVLRAGSPSSRYALLWGTEIPDESAPVLLRADGSELVGGCIFDPLPEWSKKPIGGRAVLPSGLPYDYPELFDPVGTVAAGAELMVWTRETKDWLEQHWKETFVIEAFDEILTVKLSEQPLFSRDAGTWKENGTRYGVWRAQFGAMWVLDATPFVITA